MRSSTLTFALFLALPVFIFLGCGDSSNGPDNNPPNTPSSPSPADGATGQSLSITLSWDCSDPDGDPLTYDLYFGTASNPPLEASALADDSYQISNLEISTTYYWKVIAKDNHGGQTDGSMWSFSTVSGGGEGFTFIGNLQLGGAEGIFINENYAYVTGDTGVYPYREAVLFIVDISSPSNPQQVSIYSPAIGNGIIIAPDRANPNLLNAYITNGRSGFLILDVTNPNNPVFAGILMDFAGEMFTSCSEVALKDDYAYLAYQDTGLVIVDISDRSNPTLSGRITDTDFSPRNLYVRGNRLFVISRSPGNWLRIYDISDPGSPSFICQQTLSANGHDAGIFADNNYVYVTSEYWEPNQAENGLDIFGQTGCVEMSSLPTPGYSMDIFVQGNYAYSADYGNGLIAIDVSNPTNPAIVAHNPNPSGSEHVFVSSGYIYLTAENDGLFVFRHNP